MIADPTASTAHAFAAEPSVDFADAMSALATGVAMVTSWVDGRAWGLTVSAFASVSADPPTVLVSVGSGTVTARAIEDAGSFGVSILGEQHRALARRGSAVGAPKFLDPFRGRSAATGPSPAVAGALAHLDCDVSRSVREADHTIFFGRVRDVRASAGGDPLLYFRRAYRTLAPPTTPRTKRSTPCHSS